MGDPPPSFIANGAVIFAGWFSASHPKPKRPPCSSSAAEIRERLSLKMTLFSLSTLIAMSWAVRRPLQSDAPLPYILSSWISPLNGGNDHLESSSTGTTSVCDINSSPLSPDSPMRLAIMLPLFGADSSISEAIPLC